MLKQILKHFEEILKLKTSPHSIALGFSLGTLIAILPTFGLGVFIGLLVLLVIKSASKISMLASFAVWNIFALAPLYLLSFKLGNLVLKTTQTVDFTVLGNLFFYTRSFLVGNFILATTISAICYLVIYKLSDIYQRKRINQEIEKLFK